MFSRVKSLFRNPLLKKSLVDSNYYLLSQIASKLLTILVIPILARTVTVEEFGLYDAFLLFSTFFLLIATLGIDSGIGVLIVENKDNQEKLKFFYTFSLASGLGVSILLFLVGLIIMPYYEFVDRELYYLLFLNLLFSFFSYTAFNFLRWLGDSKVAAIVTFLTSSFGVLLGLLFLYFGVDKSIYNFLIGLVLGAGICTILCVFLTHKYISIISIKSYRSSISDLLHVSLPFLPNYLINNLLVISDRFLIMHFLGGYAYGQYSMVMRISQIPSFFIQVLNKGFLPVLFRNYETEEGKIYNRKVFSVYIYSIIPIFLGFILFSKYFLVLFAGEKYDEVAHLIPIVMLSVMFFGSMGFNGFGFSIKRKTLRVTFISILSIVLNIVLSLLFIEFYGLTAVALAIMFASAVTSTLYTYFSECLYKMGYNLVQMMTVFGILSLGALIYTFSNVI